MPGLSVRSLAPELRWTRPLAYWISRRLCRFKDLIEKNLRRLT
ncbi:DUF6098 family protein [Paeniglutamicibacter sp. Y32M11]